MKQKMTRRHNHAMKNLISSVVIVSEIGNGNDCEDGHTSVISILCAMCTHMHTHTHNTKKTLQSHVNEHW